MTEEVIVPNPFILTIKPQAENWEVKQVTEAFQNKPIWWTSEGLLGED